MFATSVRVSPCSARSSPRSVGRVTVIAPLACSIVMRRGTSCASSPSGPLTITRPGEIETETPAGNSIGVLPILLMVPIPGEKSPDFSPYKADDLAADAPLLRGAAFLHPPLRLQ